MASQSPFSVFKFLLSASSLVLLLVLISSENGYALERREAMDYYHTVPVSSLISPASSCIPSAQGSSRISSVEVIHRHSPCRQDSEKPSVAEILAKDQARVNSIHSLRDNFHDLKAKLHAKSGISIGSPNYIVRIGLGKPKKKLSLAFDTGSDLTWTQCMPCAKSCYPQRDPIFDPSRSSSYSNISCKSAQCFALSSSGIAQRCSSSSTCLYETEYADGSFSLGLFAKEKLTLTPMDVFDNFLFGCGQDNGGLFNGSAGLLGLGRNSFLSLVSQTAHKYGRVFSYCLPSMSGSDGHLSFGKDAKVGKSSVKYTPLTNTQQESFYFVNLNAITVGGRKLSISRSIFQTAGTIVDSGTVITRLPQTAYRAMKTAFAQQMSEYPKAPGFAILDTCYDFSNYTNVSIPKISFTFDGDVKVDLPLHSIVLVLSRSTVCLAFAGNINDKTEGIYGNLQQQTFDVVYDVAGGKLGFAPGGCS